MFLLQKETNRKLKVATFCLPLSSFLGQIISKEINVRFSCLNHALGFRISNKISHLPASSSKEGLLKPMKPNKHTHLFSPLATF